jgi:hypothetical protein
VVNHESIKRIDKLARTVLTHGLALKKLELDSGKKEKANREKPNLDNTEKIAAMRKAAIQEAEVLLASGRIVILE